MTSACRDVADSDATGLGGAFVGAGGRAAVTWARIGSLVGRRPCHHAALATLPTAINIPAVANSHRFRLGKKNSVDQRLRPK